MSMSEALNQISYKIELNLATLPPSAKEVYSILKNIKKDLVIEQIEKHCSYSSRSIRSALKLLMDRGLIRRKVDFNDLRRHYYSISDFDSIDFENKKLLGGVRN